MMMFNEEVAKIVSTDAAVVFQNLVYWIEKNMANNKHFIDGEYWTYNSASAFEKLFVWLNKRKIERVLVELRENGLIKTGNYNDRKYDRTTWYSLTELGKTFSNLCRNRAQELSQGNTRIVAPIPDSKPDINHIYPTADSGEREKSSKPRRVTKIYGEHNNVKLTDDEYQKIQSKWNDWKEKIDIFSCDKEIHGYKYTNDYLALLKWRFNDVSPKQPEQKRSTFNDSIPLV